MTCPQCGSEYELTSKKTIWRDSDFIKCDVCGCTLKEWRGTIMYEATLIKRGKWPKKPSTHS